MKELFRFETGERAVVLLDNCSWVARSPGKPDALWDMANSMEMAMAREIEWLRAIVDMLQTTEDGQKVVPGRNYFTLVGGELAPWSICSGPTYGDGRLWSSVEAANRGLRDEPA
jgi:hypothetical protein